jgi:alkylhydroperoxidase family enzyme
MLKFKWSRLATGFLVFSAIAVQANEPTKQTQPRPVPLTRPEMKQLLEDMKSRPNRIPLPPLTDEDKVKLGERAENYESRLRYHYSPAGDPRRTGASGTNATAAAPGSPARPAGQTGPASFVGGEFSREPDPKMTLDYPFKTKLFWIVSRTNNCQYCLGHQEIKLALAGVSENEVAALDGDWSQFTPKERAAFAFARKMTYEPHHFTDADIEELRAFYTDLQILEMIFSVSGNNSINRWKEGAGIPQEKTAANFLQRAGDTVPKNRPLPVESFLTPTAEEFTKPISKVAVLQVDEKSGDISRLAVCKRPELESREEVENALAAAKQRKPRLPLVSDSDVRALIPKDLPTGALPQWMRLMANFPRDGVTRIQTTLMAEERTDLKPLLRAQVSWIIARQDRAWYAIGLAKQRLRELGQSDDQIYQLDGDWKNFSTAEQAQFTLARKLAATPIVLTDADVAVALKEVGPRDVVQLITYVTGRASFDRVTESAGLQLD